MGTIKGGDEFATMWYYGEVSVNFQGINDGGIRMAECIYADTCNRAYMFSSERGKIGDTMFKASRKFHE